MAKSKSKIDLAEVFELIDDFGLDDLMTAVVKYVVSASGKDADGQLEDLQRASRYLYRQVKDLEKRNAALEIEGLVLSGPFSYHCRSTQSQKIFNRIGRYFVVSVSSLESRIGFPMKELLAEGLEQDPAYPLKHEESYDKSHTVISIPVLGWEHQVKDDIIPYPGGTNVSGSCGLHRSAP